MAVQKVVLEMQAHLKELEGSGEATESKRVRDLIAAMQGWIERLSERNS
ncbi:MAG TPA: hypothetical protein V6D07_18530 [Trichocoleus sp.]